MRGVDFAGHDRAARFVFREDEFPEAAAGAGAKVADVLSDFEEGGGEGVEGAGAFDDGVVGGEGFELIRGGAEGEGGCLGNLGGDALGEAGVGVEAGAHCRAALGEEKEVGEGGFDAGDAAGELGDVGGEFLAEG